MVVNTEVFADSSCTEASCCSVAADTCWVPAAIVSDNEAIDSIDRTISAAPADNRLASTDTA
ncbi:hypothetical protein D3C87_2190170 [compost metagenome]